jgi:hypothetical protein
MINMHLRIASEMNPMIIIIPVPLHDWKKKSPTSADISYLSWMCDICLGKIGFAFNLRSKTLSHRRLE